MQTTYVGIRIRVHLIGLHSRQMETISLHLSNVVCSIEQNISFPQTEMSRLYIETVKGHTYYKVLYKISSGFVLEEIDELLDCKKVSIHI